MKALLLALVLILLPGCITVQHCENHTGDRKKIEADF